MFPAPKRQELAESAMITLHTGTAGTQPASHRAGVPYPRGVR
jgi:hypothetical protein